MFRGPLIVLLVALGALLGSSSAASAATLTVNNSGNDPDDDPGNGVCDIDGGSPGPCTLRAAIEESNDTGVDTIHFDTTAMGTSDITVTTALPALTVAGTTIDGCSGAASPTGPCVGLAAGGGFDGLEIQANTITVKGLAFANFQFGIDYQATRTGLVAQNNYFGLTSLGAASGGQVGVRLEGDSALIGGTSAAQRNVISGNSEIGVKISKGDSNVIRGNYFSTDPSGATGGVGFANAENIEISSSASNTASNNTIGGTVGATEQGTAACDGACNLIVGASGFGIDLAGDGGAQKEAGQTSIGGNFIGISLAGTADAGNSNDGVHAGAAPVTIGGAAAGDRNFIGGNLAGIAAAGGGTIQNNFIGISSDGTAAIPDTDDGALLTGSGPAPFSVLGNRFGGDGSEPDFGLHLDGTADGGPSATSATVRGNIFGLGTGATPPALPIQVASIRQDGSDALIGGTGAGDANVVGNTEDTVSFFSNTIAGIHINGNDATSGNGNKVLGNFIGTNANGDDLGNASAGILIQGLGDGGNNNQIGDPTDTAASANVISNNAGDAIDIQGNPCCVSGNLVARNRGSANGSTAADIYTDIFPGNDGPGNASSNQEGLEAPAVTAASTNLAAGTSVAGAVIRVFEAPTGEDNELGDFIGKTTADGSGDWSLTYSAPVSVGDFVTASQMSVPGNSTSELSPPIASEEHAPLEVDSADDTSNPDSNLADGFCNNNDNGNPCTLRAAIEQANANSGADTISFDCDEMSGVSCPGPPTIFLNNQLPDITGPVTIDGCNGGANTQPCVGLRGDFLFGQLGLSVEADSVSLHGLSWATFLDGAVTLDGASMGLDVENSWFGVRADGSDGGNSSFGLRLEGDSSQIGGTAASDQNVFGSVFSGDSLRIVGGDSNTIQGNYFGVKEDGTTASSSPTNLEVVGASGPDPAQNNVIGGTVTGAAATSVSCDGPCNVFSFSDFGGAGIRLDGNDLEPVSGTSIKGNFVGLGPSGTTSQGNTNNGIEVSGSDTGMTGTTIGGTAAGDRNYIGGNDTGIATSVGLLVQNNFIGLRSDGTGAVPDSTTSADLEGTSGNPVLFRDNRLGGDGGNPTQGLRLRGNGGSVTGNAFGLGTGTTPPELPIDAAAIDIHGSSNTIGGTGAGEANVVTSSAIGIQVVDTDGGGDNNTIVGNLIGTDATGADHGNDDVGIRISAGSGDATGNQIGGTTAASENVIDNSSNDAIQFPFTGNLSTDNLILRNRGVNGGNDSGDQFLDLNENGQGNTNGTSVQGGIDAPTITSATSELIQGTGAMATATVRVYRTTAGEGEPPNDIIAFVAETTADGGGNWSLNLASSPLPGEGKVTATQTKTPSFGTSELSDALVYEDETEPVVTIDSGPSGPTGDDTPSFTFSATDLGGTISGFQCRVDGAAFGTCSGPGNAHTTAALGPGAHTFEVRATDGSNNTATASRGFTVVPSNAFAVGSLNGKQLSLTVSAAGTVTVNDAAAAASGSSAIAAAKKRLKPSSASGGPGVIVVTLKLTKPAKSKLREKGKLKVNARITFTPTGGTPSSQTVKLKIKK